MIFVQLYMHVVQLSPIPDPLTSEEIGDHFQTASRVSVQLLQQKASLSPKFTHLFPLLLTLFPSSTFASFRDREPASHTEPGCK